MPFFKKFYRSIALATLFPLSTLAQTTEPLSSPTSAAKKHGVFQFESLQQLTAKARTLDKVGMRLTDLEVHQEGSQLSFSGVFQPGTGKYTITEHSSWSAFESQWQSLSSQSYRLLDVERVWHNGQLKHYAVYGEGNGAYSMYAQTWNSFISMWQSNSNNGLRLVDVDVVKVNGQNHYLGTYLPGNDAYIFYSTDSQQVFFDKYDEFRQSGMTLVDVNMLYNSNQSQRYTGVWRSGSNQGELFLHTSWEDFQEEWVNQSEQGAELLDFDISKGDSNNTFQYYISSYVPSRSAMPTDLDLTAMADYLETTYDGNVNGMAYAITQNGQLAVSGATGWAQRAPDPYIEMSPTARLSVASVTKMLTAPLVYNLLDANGLTLNSPIHPWLPSGWARGDGFSSSSADPITFGDLLKHESGLAQFHNGLSGSEADQWNTSWEGLQYVVQRGTSTSRYRSYQNMNYALTRVLIPSLWANVGGPLGPVTKTNASDRYLQFMDFLVTGNLGIDDVSCWPQSGYLEALMYNNENDTGLSGWSFQPQTSDNCGGYGKLHLSALELAEYWTAVRFNDDIMTDADRQTMRTQRAGIWSTYSTEDGTAYSHDGLWIWNNRESKTCLMELPNNVVASIVINSHDPGSTGFICTTLRNAYNAAAN